jgi:hypothetical protein
MSSVVNFRVWGESGAKFLKRDGLLATVTLTFQPGIRVSSDDNRST